MKRRHTEGPSRRQRGFTFIEILVALAIIATALVSIFHLFSQTLDAETATRFYTTAPLLANEQMALVRSGALSGGDVFGDSENYPGYQWRIEIREIPSEAANALGEAAENLKQVDVTINNENGQSYHIRSYEFLP